jgi:hypothetical protein
MDLLQTYSFSDAVERFQLMLFMIMILWENIVMGQWGQSIERDLTTIVFWVGCVILCEMMVDWVKHAFITRYNDLRPEVYRVEFRFFFVFPWSYYPIAYWIICTVFFVFCFFTVRCFKCMR